MSFLVFHSCSGAAETVDLKHCPTCQHMSNLQVASHAQN